MTRIGLLTSEPLRPQMAGIGIRYLEMARRLPRAGLRLVVVSPGASEELAELLPAEVEARPFERGRLARTFRDCDAAVAQGQLANDLLLEVPSLPAAIDLYDPWLVENLNYRSTLGLDPYRNDHATWVLQLSRGDFFLCSSEEQKNFYLGFLTALGRVNPERVERDPDLDGLIAPVPFGVPEELPPHEPFLAQRTRGERRLLFGGLYDWYDPWPVIEALQALDRRPWKLLFIRNPNLASTPQRVLNQVEEWVRSQPHQEGWSERIQILDWVPFDRRYDLLRDVDLLVATHRPGLETRLAMRTRFLEALAAGCSILTTEGGTVSRLLKEWQAGWVVPPSSPEHVQFALEEVFAAEGERQRRRQSGRELVARFHWQRALEPLVAFCLEPHRDSTKEAFAFRPPTLCPNDSLSFRMRRRLRLWGSPFRE